MRLRIFRIAIASLGAGRAKLFALVIACAVAQATLTASLIAGDSVRGTLASIAQARLGSTASLLLSEERFVNAKALKDSAPLIAYKGRLLLDDAELSSAELYGIDDDFFSFAPNNQGAKKAPKKGYLYLNAVAAEALGAVLGSEILVSFRKPDSMPLDAPLSGTGGGLVARSLVVAEILSEDDFGRFSPRAEQRERPAAFIAREELAVALGKNGKANAALSGLGPMDANAKLASRASLPEDFGFTLREIGSGNSEITLLDSDRVFMETNVAKAAEALGSEAVSGYFLDSIKLIGRESPYCFGVGLGKTALEKIYGFSGDLMPGEALLTEWEANDLGAKLGDRIDISLRRVVKGALSEETASLKVIGIVRERDLSFSRALMPRFPGMADAESCSNWDPGIALNLGKIRPKDEAYWKERGGSPRLIVSTQTAANLWASEWGELTGELFFDSSPAEVSTRLASLLSPGDFGLVFKSVDAYGKSGRGLPLDFGALFLGLSMFISIAALILAALLFGLWLGDKETETGILFALGWSRLRVTALRSIEGAIMAAFGAIVGTGLGILASTLIVSALKGPWSGAVAGTGLSLFILPSTLVLSAFAFLIVVLAYMTRRSWRSMARSPRSLINGEASSIQSPRHARLYSARRAPRAAFLFAGIALCLAIALAFANDIGAAYRFLASGAAALVAILLGSYSVLASRKSPSPLRSAGGIGLFWALYNPKAITVQASLLAVGLFIVIAVGANPYVLKSSLSGKASGTGGFSLYIESSGGFAPSEAISRSPKGGSLVVGKLRDGDDASCLNLARSGTPPIVGLNSVDLDGRFNFSELASSANPSQPWKSLDMPGDEIPVIADATSLEWNLGLKVGDSIETSDSKGSPVTLRIVGSVQSSIFQGSLIMSTDRYRQLFPADSGARLALWDSESSGVPNLETIDSLRGFLKPYGAIIESCENRLGRFLQVETAYLDIFLFLGGIGIFLGSLGFAAAAARAAERQGAMAAILEALGLKRRGRIAALATGQCIALGIGVGAGALSGLVTLIPAAGLGNWESFSAILIICASALACGLIAIVGICALKTRDRGMLAGRALSEEA